MIPYQELLEQLDNFRKLSTKKQSIYVKEYKQEIIDSLKEYTIDEISEIWRMMLSLFNTDLLVDCSPIFLEHESLYSKDYIHNYLFRYNTNALVMNSYWPVVLHYLSFSPKQYIEMFDGLYLIEGIKEKVSTFFKQTKPKKKSDVFNVLSKLLSQDEFKELLTEESSQAKGDYLMSVLEHLRLLNLPAVNSKLEIPPVKKLEIKEEQLISEKEAKDLARVHGGDWNRYYPDIDLKECYLLFNNLQLTDKEIDIVKKRNTRDKGEDIFFNKIGVEFHRRFLPIASRKENNCINWIVYGLRNSYTESNIFHERPIPFDDDFNEIPAFDDLRQLEQILKEQTLIPNLNPADYIVRSIDGEALFERPDAVWPFFAENYEYLDYALSIYFPRQLPALTTIKTLKVLNCFPELPPRYLYATIKLLAPNINEISYMAFNIVKKVAEIKSILESLLPVLNKKDQKAIEFWIEELDTESYNTPKQCFVHNTKFWNIQQEDNTYTVEYGGKGQKARTTTKEFAGAKACRLAYNKIIEKKLSEGYVEIHPKETDKVEEVEKTIDFITPILQTNGQEYLCFKGDWDEEGEEFDDAYLVTNINDKQHIKATIQYIVRILQGKVEEDLSLYLPNDFLSIYQLNGEVAEPLSSEQTFEDFCNYAYEDKELHPWLVHLLEGIMLANSKIDEYICLNLNGDLMGMHLAFLLAQDPSNHNLFMDYMHSVQRVDNHTHHSHLICQYESDITTEALMNFYAAYMVNATCSGNAFEMIIATLEDFTEWDKNDQDLLLKYLQIECDYVIKKIYGNPYHVGKHLELFFDEMFPDNEGLAETFCESLHLNIRTLRKSMGL